MKLLVDECIHLRRELVEGVKEDGVLQERSVIGTISTEVDATPSLESVETRPHPDRDPFDQVRTAPRKLSQLPVEAIALVSEWVRKGSAGDEAQEVAVP